MRPLARSLSVLLAFAFIACGKRPVSDDGGAAGAAASGRGGSTAGASGGNGGSTAGASGGNGGNGGATAGASGGNGGSAAGASGAKGGSSGSGASAGTGGGGSAGTTGEAGRGGTTGTAGSVGGAIAGTGGATAGAGGNGLGPLRLVIFYTRWGTSYPEWWPTGADRSFTMSAMMQPLEPHKSEIILLSGLSNANLYMDAGDPLRSAGVSNGDAMKTLLTAHPVASDGPARGPSLETTVGDCGGAAGPPLRLAVGKFETDDTLRVSYDATGAAISGERDPRAVATRLLGHTVTAPDPDGDIDANYPALGAAHMDVLTEALATSKTCAAVLAWGDLVVPKWIGLNDTVHAASHDAQDLYSAVNSATAARPNNRFATLQRWYAQQFASLLERMRAVPVGGGTLLDRSVVVWISESGAGPDHTGYYVPVVIAGRGGGRLDVGRFVEIKPHKSMVGQIVDTWAVTRTQGDLLAALAGLWGVTSFGDPAITRQPLTDILLP